MSEWQSVLKVELAGELVQAGGGGDNSQERDDGFSRGPASRCAATGCGCPQPQDQVQCSSVPLAMHAHNKQEASTCCKTASTHALTASETEPLLCCAMLCCAMSIVQCAMRHGKGHSV